MYTQPYTSTRDYILYRNCDYDLYLHVSNEYYNIYVLHKYDSYYVVDRSDYSVNS